MTNSIILTDENGNKKGAGTYQSHLNVGRAGGKGSEADRRSSNDSRMRSTGGNQKSVQLDNSKIYFQT